MSSLPITGATLADGTAPISPWWTKLFMTRRGPSGALPGSMRTACWPCLLVDSHTHLREPGREDAERIASASLSAGAGRLRTCVHAMANTDPVTDTAEAAEFVADLGRRQGHCEVRRGRHHQGAGRRGTG
ncbi:MAG: hypothetical protein IPM11_00185 [Micropruina sp.]|nr:hypothetical protein [Micropruina sp.]